MIYKYKGNVLKVREEFVEVEISVENNELIVVAMEHKDVPEELKIYGCPVWISVNTETMSCIVEPRIFCCSKEWQKAKDEMEELVKKL